MKRILVFGLAAGLCMFVSGCGPDTHDTLIQQTTGLMDKASAEVAAIKNAVAEATAAARKGNPFDLKDAIDATKSLKKTGEQAQRIKQTVTEIRASITDDDKKANEAKYKQRISGAFKELLSKREELRAALEDAEKLGDEGEGNLRSQVKLAIEDLRRRLIEAEGPFEALAH